MNINNQISLNFKGKNISHDAWAISLDYFIKKIWLKSVLKTLNDNKEYWNLFKKWPKYKYNKADICYEQIMWYMKWYTNPTEISRTIFDPIHKEVTNTNIPSQSTFSRVNTTFSQQDFDNFRNINLKIISSYYQNLVNKNWWEKLDKVDISDDSTKIQTYWKQEWSDYIHHYWINWYHPDLTTDDIKKLVIEWVLRNWNVYSSNSSELLIEESIELVKDFTKQVIFRSDSAYAKPEILNVLHSYWDLVTYFIKAKTYMSWINWYDFNIEYNEKTYNNPMQLPKEYFESEIIDKKTGENKIKLIPKYFKLKHKCNSWEQEENIVLQVKYIDRQVLFEEWNKNVEMIITNSDLDWENVFKEYWKRGKQEKIIEELKNDWFAKNLSWETKIQNSCMFQMKIMAYNLMQILRLETLYWTKYENCRISTMRLLLVKIWWKIVNHSRKIVVKLAESFPYKKRFYVVMNRLKTMEFSLLC